MTSYYSTMKKSAAIKNFPQLPIPYSSLEKETTEMSSHFISPSMKRGDNDNFSLFLGSRHSIGPGERQVERETETERDRDRER